MGTVYKVSGPNSGKDVSITITAFNGDGSQAGQWNAAQFGILMHFEVESDYSMMEMKSIQNEGEVYYEALPHGAKCNIKINRAGGSGNAGLEDLESLYRGQSKNGNQLYFTVMYQTKNRDQSTQTRALIHGKPHNWKLGAYTADQPVMQGVDFVSSDLQNNS